MIFRAFTKLYYCGAAASALALASCGGQSSAANPPAPPPAQVSVIDVQPAEVPVFAEYPAQTFARDMVEVRGRVDGYIQKRLFEVGSDVKAGQPLYILDLRPYQADVAKAKSDVEKSVADAQFAKDQVAVLQAQADVAQAEANLAKARQDVTRLEPLVKEEAAAQQDLDNARAALKAQQAALEARQATLRQTTLQTKNQQGTSSAQVEANRALLRSAELNLEYATIRSPINGRVGDSLIQVGGLVSKTAATPLTTVVPLDPIWVRFKVSEGEYLAYTKTNGSTATSKVKLSMLLADNSELPYPGKIRNTVNQVDPKTGTLELQATFPNPRHTLLPGQYGRVRFVTEVRHGALLIPQRAVQELQGQQTVLTVGPENKVQVRAVVPGERVGNKWIINQGLKAGDRVIVEGTMKVQPGAPVSPQPWQGEPDAKAKQGS